MPEISKKGQIWIVLVLRLALNLANALEPPCRFSAGNEALRWMNEDGSLRFPSYLNEDILGVEDEDTVLEDLADTTTEWSSGSFPCHFSEQTQELLCKDGIDFKYIKTLKNKQIRALIVDSYNKKERPWRRGCGMDTESLAKNPAVKVTAAIRLQDIHVKINTVLDVRKTAEDTFAIDGEIFSNKVIKIGWKYKGEAVSVNGQGNATAIEVAVVSSEYESTWRLNGSIEYANGTATFSGNISSTDDFSPAVPFGGSLEVNGTVKENMFVGTFEAKQVNVAGEISGRATKYMSKITIPSGAFSGINVRDMLFKNSHFFGDFHDRSFEGRGGGGSDHFHLSTREIT
ncbi:UNVERIFIED_CONTAM: hypothetical protein PYX00_006072 [Menopon gallinae]|uniref:Uncharacterized protein n=1 Tax=Menopon gallinae TaxID=328185 RepID=A0AAW2HV27_9NEOP